VVHLCFLLFPKSVQISREVFAPFTLITIEGSVWFVVRDVSHALPPALSQPNTRTSPDVAGSTCWHRYSIRIAKGCVKCPALSQNVPTSSVCILFIWISSAPAKSYANVPPLPRRSRYCLLTPCQLKTYTRCHRSQSSALAACRPCDGCPAIPCSRPARLEIFASVPYSPRSINA
jgi:hypothetical protein